MKIGGPESLTFNQLAAAVQKAAGRTKEPRHIPRLILRAMAHVFGSIRPELARQGPRQRSR